MKRNTKKHSKVKAILDIIAGILQVVNGVLLLIKADGGKTK